MIKWNFYGQNLKATLYVILYLNNHLDRKLPDKQTTVCETEGLCV